jgi:hypothetical protein
MHYNPSVLEAFNSVEHSEISSVIAFLFSFVCVIFFILFVNYQVLKITSWLRHPATSNVVMLRGHKNTYIIPSMRRNKYMISRSHSSYIKQDTSTDTLNSLSEENFYE